MNLSESLFACFLVSEVGSDGYKGRRRPQLNNCLCRPPICDEYAKMISGLCLLFWQLKSHGNSLNCHGKIMELYYQISVRH